MASESRLKFNWGEMAAGAVAALSGAVTASALGLYGTLMGAGVMSAVTTVVATVSHHYFSRTHARLRQLRGSTGTEAGQGGQVISRLRQWRGLRGLAGGTVLVATTAVITVAGLQLMAQRPLGELLFGGEDTPQTRTVIIKQAAEPDGSGPGLSSSSSDTGTETGTLDAETASRQGGVPAPTQSPDEDAGNAMRTGAPSPASTPTEPATDPAPDPETSAPQTPEPEPTEGSGDTGDTGDTGEEPTQPPVEEQTPPEPEPEETPSGDSGDTGGSNPDGIPESSSGEDRGVK